MNKRIITTIAAAVMSFSAFAQTASQSTRIFMDMSMGRQTSYQSISLFDKSMGNSTHVSLDYVLGYNIKETFAAGVKCKLWSWEMPYNNETIGISFVGATLRPIRPMKLTDDLIVKMYGDITLGCTFLDDKFEWVDQPNKTSRYGFGVDLSVGLKVPLFSMFEIGVGMGSFWSLLGKPDVEADVPAKEYAAGQQMVLTTRVVGTIALTF